MWLEDFTYLMPLWMLALVAWFPASIVALTMRLYAIKSTTDDQRHLLGAAFGLASTAYVFFASFAVNTLWNQNLDIYESWERLSFRAKYLRTLVDAGAPSELSTVDNLLSRGSAYLQSKEALYSPMNAVGFFTGDGDAALDKITAAAESPEAAGEISSAYDAMVIAGQDYITQLNAPGIPDVYFIAIVLMGLVVASLLAVNPPRKSRVASHMLAATVFIVGLLQLPLWVLNSEHFEAELIGTLPLTDAGLPSITAQTIGVSVVGVVLIALVGLLTWEARVRKRREDAQAADASPDSGQDHDPVTSPQ